MEKRFARRNDILKETGRGLGVLLLIPPFRCPFPCLIHMKIWFCILTGFILWDGICREGPLIPCWDFNVKIRCRHRLPSPELAGFTTLEGLREAAAQYPHLRPCPRQRWQWIYRKACKKCADRVEVELEGSESGYEKGPLREQRAKSKTIKLTEQL